LAIAIDWLDSYRHGDIDAILSMHSPDAVIECGCGGLKVITGTTALRAYWRQRLANLPASALDDLRPHGDGATISYLANDGVVSATLEIDQKGMIKVMRCGPSSAQR
jgi:ketosteroid isomerase-like protein